MVHASVQIDQLHPPMSEPLKGIDLRWIDDVLDYAGDHTRSVTNWLDRAARWPGRARGWTVWCVCWTRCEPSRGGAIIWQCDSKSPSEKTAEAG